MATFFSNQDDDLLLHCHIQPKASKTAIIGIYNERLKIQVASPPVDGKANSSLIKYLSKCLRVPKSRISVIRGETSRLKTLKIQQLEKLPDDFPYGP